MSAARRYGKRIVGTLVFAAVVYGLLYAISDNVAQNRADDQSVADRASLRRELAEEKAIVDALAEQVEQLGGDPIVRPEDDTRPEVRYVPVPGRDGKDAPPAAPGEDGEDSTVPGPEGPASTLPGPKGDKGDKGDPGESITGPKGEPGRGIEDLACTGGLTPIRFTVTYTDGTSESFTCGQLEPVPEPTSE